MTMPRKKLVPILVAATLFAFGLTLYLHILFQSSRFTILDHGLKIEPALFLFVFVAMDLMLLAIWAFGAGTPARRLGIEPAAALRSAFWAMLPLAFLLLSPLLLRYYTTRQDLKTRLGLLAIFILLGFGYLMFSEFRPFFRRILGRLEKWEGVFSALSPGKKLALLFFVAFLIYQGVTLIMVEEGVTFSGDEPNYLLTSHSLLRDGDINLANNYANQDYFSFYSKKDNPRLKLGIYGRSGRKGKGYIYPINLPGVSALMLPFYGLSQHFSGRVLTFILKGSLSIWAVLLGLQLYLFIYGLWKKERLSLLLWFLYSFSAPVLFYATHLYPEIIIALFAFTVFRMAVSGNHLSGSQYLFLGFLLGTFPWFGLKYTFILGPLAAVALYFFWKQRRPLKNLALFLAFPILSVLLFFAFVHYLYGSFSLFSVYEGVMTPEGQAAFKDMVLSIPLNERVDAFFDYFLDQRDGLLLYSPFYLFSFLGLVEIFKRNKKMFWSLLAVGLPFLFNYAFFTHRQGYSPQARVLMPLSWAGAVAISYFLVYNRKKIYAFLFRLLGFLSLAIAGILIVQPSFLYQPTTHEFTSRPGALFVHLSSLHLFLPPFLPSFIKINNLGYWPNYVWAAAIIIFIIIYALGKRDRPLGQVFHRASALILISIGFILWVLFPRTVPYPAKTVAYTSQRSLGFYLGPMGEGVVAKEAGDFYFHYPKSYKFFFGSKTRLEKVRLIYGSEKGKFALKAALFDLPLLDDLTEFETKECIIQPEAYYKTNNLYYYEINLEITHLTDETMLIDPFLFQVIPVRD